MNIDGIPDRGNSQPDMAPVEIGLAVLRRACDRAVDELGCTVPVAQQRVLLIVDQAGGTLDLSRLAARLTASPPATSRLCNRMMAAGLLTTNRAKESRARPWCTLTGSGRRLASWMQDRQREALSKVLNSLGAEARNALVHGLTELAATAEIPS